jgi:hypothetical protein
MDTNVPRLKKYATPFDKILWRRPKDLYDQTFLRPLADSKMMLWSANV